MEATTDGFSRTMAPTDRTVKIITNACRVNTRIAELNAEMDYTNKDITLLAKKWLQRNFFHASRYNNIRLKDRRNGADADRIIFRNSQRNVM